MDSVDKVNLSLFLSRIRKSISGCLEGFIWEKADLTTDEAVKKTVFSYMESIKDKKLINDYDVKVEHVFHSWRMLYPKLSKRILAIIINKLQRWFNLFLNTHYPNPEFKWYHFLLPFKIVDEVDFLEDKMEEDWEDHVKDEEISSGYNREIKLDWIMENIKTYIYHSRSAILIYPYWSLDANLFIRPIMPIEYINVTFKLDLWDYKREIRCC